MQLRVLQDNLGPLLAVWAPPNWGAAATALRGPVFNLLPCYLNERKICAKIKEKISKFYIVNCGVPFGAIVFFLFLLFVDDLPNVSKFNTTLFAGDTNLHLSRHNIKSLQSQTTEDVRKINDWINTNK